MDEIKQPTPETGFVKNEYRILQKILAVMPKPFMNQEAFGDIDDAAMNRRVLAFAQLVIDDFNYIQPETGLTTKIWPEGLDSLLVSGVLATTALMMQMKWTLNDLSYSDNGLSLTLDRVQKLNTSYENIWKRYQDQAEKVKLAMWKRTVVALGTPRFQNQLGQFVRATFGWGF